MGMDQCWSRPELQPAGERFWHCVQLYEKPAFLAATVAAYAAQGLVAREAVIIVAKDRNRTLFETEMAARGVDLDAVRNSGQLTMLSAEDTLSHFMGSGWPDQDAFNRTVGGVVRTASGAGWAGVRAFGEMVAVLWEAGHPAMALRLEHLWDELAETEKFSLLCAYALSSFEGAGQAEGFLGVCDSHSIVLPSEGYLNLSGDRERLRAVAKLQRTAATVTGFGEPLPAAELVTRACGRSHGTALIAAIRIAVDTGVTIDTAVLPGSERGTSVLQTAPGEFTLIAEGLPDFAAAHNLAHEIRYSLPPSACVGVDLSTAQSAAPSDILQNADIALRHAKRRGKGHTEFYSSRLGKSAHLHRHLESHLRGALERGEMQVWFQPEISLRALATSRFEALLRWFPSSDCSVPPSTFVEVAEESGLILSIGEWVLRQSCQRAAQWQGGEFDGVGVAVNVSAVQFAEPGFVSMVASILRETGLHPALLELEMTESVLVRNFEESSQGLNRLRQLGVTLAIDDFGTGYSSLSYLQQLPVDALKIDRCFVTELGHSRSRAPVLRGMIGIARELGIRVIAEGVETPEQFNAIANFGCDEVQGYLLGRPQPEPRLWSGQAADEACLAA